MMQIVSSSDELPDGDGPSKPPKGGKPSLKLVK